MTDVIIYKNIAIYKLYNDTIYSDAIVDLPIHTYYNINFQDSEHHPYNETVNYLKFNGAELGR